MKYILMMLLSFSVMADTKVEESYKIGSSWKYTYIQEFTPKGQPNMYCIVARSSTGMGISCFPKR